jgi:ATP-binding cassette, subfamily F, member 3
MLTISGISKSFGGRTLFSDVSLQVNRGDRIGLVGPNGAGKSTFFSLVLQQEQPDEGEVALQRGTTLGFLPQESAPAGEETVVELATAISPEFAEVSRKLKAWDAAHPDDLNHEDDLHTRFNELGGYQVESKAKKILKGLSFRDSDFDRPAREMSGGWVMRAHLARLLVLEPDLLMLDEPTNHLDLESLLWFQGYLQGYPGAILMISHDREFLNALVTGIVEIRQKKLVRYTGDFDAYLAQRAANEAQHLAAFQTQQKEIAHLQAFADRFKAKASKATQAQSKLKQIERMEKIEAPVAADKKVGFRFPQPIRSGQRVVALEQVHFAYGATKVYQGLEFEVERGERIVLVGPNGAGKSTLLKLLADKLQPQAGARVLGHNVTAGYYSQYRVDMLQPARTVLEEALDTEAKVTEQFVRTLLGSFLFSGDSVFKKVEVLSGGEKSRLALVKLLLNPPNLLLMDEPTTHLDMSSIDALIDALTQFEGTLVFISHDVHFIKQLANKVVHVAGGKLTPYLGDYEFYLHKTKALSARSALTAGSTLTAGGAVARPGNTQPAASKSAKDDDKARRQQAHKEREAQKAEEKKLRPLVQKLERQIGELEDRQKAIAAELEDPAAWLAGGASKELNKERADNDRRLKQLTAEWEAAATRLTAIRG